MNTEILPTLEAAIRAADYATRTAGNAADAARRVSTIPAVEARRDLEEHATWAARAVCLAARDADDIRRSVINAREIAENAAKAARDAEHAVNAIVSDAWRMVHATRDAERIALDAARDVWDVVHVAE